MAIAPTTSTTMMLALGDALAVALLERKGFSAEDFRALHPGGKLGQKLLRVADLMHVGKELPLISVESGMQQAILEMTAKTYGCVGAIDADGHLAGIITDGDLRRHIDDVDLLRRYRARGDDGASAHHPGRRAGGRGAACDERESHHLAVRARGRQAGRHRAPARLPQSRRGVTRAAMANESDNLPDPPVSTPDAAPGLGGMRKIAPRRDLGASQFRRKGRRGASVRLLKIALPLVVFVSLGYVGYWWLQSRGTIVDPTLIQRVPRRCRQGRSDRPGRQV